MKRPVSLAFAACLLAAIALAPPAGAQWWNVGMPQNNNNGNDKDKKPRVAPLPAKAFKTEVVQKEPQLPLMPYWTGQKPLFINGHRYPNLPPIDVYTCTWAYREAAGTVIGWYREALPGAGFQVNNRISRENMIIARHSREPVEIQLQVSPSSRQNYKCLMELRYTRNPKFAPREKTQGR